jgi:hypothetical protein
MFYYDEKAHLKKWERLFLLRAQVRYMEEKEQKPKAAETSGVLEEMRSGATVDINAIHTGISWQQANEVNREIAKFAGLDAYRDGY